MSKAERDIKRKLRVLRYAEARGSVAVRRMALQHLRSRLTIRVMVCLVLKPT
jgi:hypothetical protein